MLKDSSAVFYKKKERFQKRARESYEYLLKKKKKEKNQEFARKPCRNHSEEKETGIWS